MTRYAGFVSLYEMGNHLKRNASPLVMCVGNTRSKGGALVESFVLVTGILLDGTVAFWCGRCSNESSLAPGVEAASTYIHNIVSGRKPAEGKLYVPEDVRQTVIGSWDAGVLEIARKLLAEKEKPKSDQAMLPGLDLVE